MTAKYSIHQAGRNNGKAAELRNTAAGRGNTKLSGHTELDINKVAGELFVGDIDIVQGLSLIHI